MVPQEKKNTSWSVSEKTVSELVFGIAHQIRNPLAIIRSQTQHLLSLVCEKEYRHIPETIIHSVDFLNHRLDELVDFTKPVELDLRNCAPSEIIEHILPLIRLRCELQNIRSETHYEKPFFPVRVDPDRVQEALLQIALNAIEAMPHGGELSIRVFQDKVAKNTFFQIIDSGVGISQEDLKNVFSPFFTTRRESAGLGLSIALKIFELHGGSLKLESVSGKGATVTGTIPGL
ncbi:MAG: hypothetical protein A2X34_04825 [Elusimicrobia bacterium GWC2_51_8]|nr:MAG: hypothetical protein A2X33_05580 [Elusimicrobia bacterium GWA2_51_34]OGR60412.1 MAG: hypothetical protein A2X34_04825 [Elusimicrobia bacterium GWC2_51_8]OGR86179.1 MAG: hypothetical protein A2021_06065 [Elusimicrobia bacterium GWF2_52_66]HAF94825.1 hypothetical protein [Elusimicrobiota bacterium]HCE96953.1 hypothetical protein [Elusimicrobiota bacterium]